MAYSTYGKLNVAHDNAILVTTWYTGTSKIMEQLLIGKGRALDPAGYFIVIVNQTVSGLSSSPSNTVHALEVVAVADLRAVGQADELLHTVVVDQFAHRPVFCCGGLGLLLVGGRVASLHDLGALDRGHAACTCKADLSIAPEGQLSSATTMAVAKDPAGQAGGG